MLWSKLKDLVKGSDLEPVIEEVEASIDINVETSNPRSFREVIDLLEEVVGLKKVEMEECEP